MPGCGLFPDVLDTAEEAIALPGQRFEKSCGTRVVPEHGTDTTDALVDTLLVIDPGAVGPQVIANLVAGDDLAGSTEQQSEQPGRLGRQSDQHPGPAELLLGEVELEADEAHELRG